MESSGKVRRTETEFITKPLPQILDEMEATIRAAAEAARRAEQAAREAKAAARAATKASAEVAKAADVAIKASKEAVQRTEMGTQVSAGVRRFFVVFEKAGDNYSAYSPDIPGCIATGATRDEVEKNIKEAINFHIEGLREDSLPLPEPASFTEYIEV